MLPDSQDIVATALCGLPLTIFLAEAFLCTTWDRAYFTIGLPLLTFRIPVVLHHTNVPPVATLEARLQSDTIGSLVFREMEPCKFAFRLKTFQFPFMLGFPLMRFFPLLHGTLFFDQENNRVVVKGFADWLLLYFGFAWLGFWILDADRYIRFSCVSIVAILLALLFGIQVHRYFQIASVAADVWSRKQHRIRLATARARSHRHGASAVENDESIDQELGSPA